MNSLCIGASLAAALLGAPFQTHTKVKNIVLVHGAFVDGSGWRPVYQILARKGYHVSVVQEPLTSLEDDVAAVQRVLDLQRGPCILVGHSYGGAIITQAGNDDKVVGLVYVAAHALDKGETEARNGKRTPAAGKKPLRTSDGYLYLDPAVFRRDFAADLPAATANFAAHSQMLTKAEVFTTPSGEPAWRTKSSWYAVAGADRTINPNLERMYAKRAHSHTIVIPGASHSVYESRPKEVAALIEQAATRALKE